LLQVAATLYVTSSSGITTLYNNKEGLVLKHSTTPLQIQYKNYLKKDHKVSSDFNYPVVGGAPFSNVGRDILCVGSYVVNVNPINAIHYDQAANGVGPVTDFINICFDIVLLATSGMHGTAVRQYIYTVINYVFGQSIISNFMADTPELIKELKRQTHAKVTDKTVQAIYNIMEKLVVKHNESLSTLTKLNKESKVTSFLRPKHSETFTRTSAILKRIMAES
jgi:hypothetical protein